MSLQMLKIDDILYRALIAILLLTSSPYVLLTSFPAYSVSKHEG